MAEIYNPPETWEDLISNYSLEGDEEVPTIAEIREALLSWVLAHGRQCVQVNYFDNRHMDVLWGDFKSEYPYSLLEVDTEKQYAEPTSGSYTAWLQLSPTGDKFFNMLEES